MRTLDDLLNSEVWDTRDLIEIIGNQHPDDEGLDADEKEELTRAYQLQELVEDTPDYQYGETVIADSYFVEYARQLAEDCGMVTTDGKWPTYCIDWEYAARELQADYSPLEFEGKEWWVRA